MMRKKNGSGASHRDDAFPYTTLRNDARPVQPIRLGGRSCLSLGGLPEPEAASPVATIDWEQAFRDAGFVDDADKAVELANLIWVDRVGPTTARLLLKMRPAKFAKLHSAVLTAKERIRLAMAQQLENALPVTVDPYYAEIMEKERLKATVTNLGRIS